MKSRSVSKAHLLAFFASSASRGLFTGVPLYAPFSPSCGYKDSLILREKEWGRKEQLSIAAASSNKERKEKDKPCRGLNERKRESGRESLLLLACCLCFPHSPPLPHPKAGKTTTSKAAFFSFHCRGCFQFWAITRTVEKTGKKQKTKRSSVGSGEVFELRLGFFLSFPHSPPLSSSLFFYKSYRTASRPLSSTTADQLFSLTAKKGTLVTLPRASAERSTPAANRSCCQGEKSKRFLEREIRPAAVVACVLVSSSRTALAPTHTSSPSWWEPPAETRARSASRREQ